MSIVKQHELLKLIIENEKLPANKQKSMRKLLVAAGYSEQTGNVPSLILKTASWQKLIDDLLPDNKIIEKLNNNAMQEKSLYASNQAIDLIMKIKGKYAPQKFELTTPEDEMTDEEIEQELKTIEEEKKKRQ